MFTHFLVHKRILQTRKGGLDGAHAPFRRLPHWCRLLLPTDIQPLLILASWHGQDEIIMRRLDEEGSIHLADLTVHFPSVSWYTSPSLLWNLPQYATWALRMHPGTEKGIGNGPIGAKKQKPMSHSDHASTSIRCKNEPRSQYCPTAASKAWAYPMWTTHQIGVVKRHQWLHCTIWFHLLRES